ncbi:hypothetical protein BO71DRAFT_423081 [Aspergillus ellipticus CBS 707.79]|uniref:Rhodopsin domain-containing protein n=1 Tax=Aspergillus ellipticus CBS 707.79 TaxID=1448320 RepID=A0A319CWV9_9EURO|nr:hypothetical protein BO71DRAFT_423081 [Aspergillus ellipticus CBS 707.79]
MKLPLRVLSLPHPLQMRAIDTRAHYPDTQILPDHVAEIAIATLYLMVLGIAQSDVIFQATTQGYGKRESALNAHEINYIEKIIYASDLLYVLALSLAKISVLQLLSKLTVNKLHKKICLWSIILVTVWTIPVFFTLAFRCGVPSPWKPKDGQCIEISTQFIFWAAITPIDIITELITCILPIYVVKPLVLCVSLMTACIPCLKPFLDAFDSGMLNVAIRNRLAGTNSNSYSNSYALASMGRGLKESTTLSRYVKDEIEGLGTSAAAFAVTAPLDREERGGREPDMSIQRTDQWSVREEYVDVDPKEEREGSEVNGLPNVIGGKLWTPCTNAAPC